VRDEDLWPAIHAYQKAVAHGDAPAIRCPDCRIQLMVVVGSNGHPAFKCYSCREVSEPGLRVWETIASNIHEVAEMLRKNDN
jgi:phage FluMu protein Com